jgi:hypothetical protein
VDGIAMAEECIAVRGEAKILKISGRQGKNRIE